MRIEYDEAKAAENLEKHGLAFSAFEGFDIEPVIVEDDRADYGETPAFVPLVALAAGATASSSRCAARRCG